MEMNGIYEVPECMIIKADEMSEDQIVGGSMSETVAGAVAGAVASAVTGVAIDSIPGPAIPG